MNLECLAPGARRRTRTAGTTETSLLGLLDVENHGLKVQKGVFEVNVAIAVISSGRDCDGALTPIGYTSTIRPNWTSFRTGKCSKF